jgi:nitroreductase
MNHEEIREALNWRYAVKKFDPSKKIRETDWQTLEESLRLAPSSYNLQPWKFIVVQNPELRKKLRAASRDQSGVEEASHFVVVTFMTKLDMAQIEKHIRRVVEVRGGSVADHAGFRKSAEDTLLKGRRSNALDQWAMRQSFLALGMILETAALLKIDTCPMEGIEPDEYDKILNLTSTGYQTIAGIALGYRHPDDKYQFMPKVRFIKEDVIKVL